MIADIETLKGFALFSFYNPETKEWHEFEINEYRNHLYSFLKFLEVHREYYFVFYNGIKFDCQVIEMLMRKHVALADLSNKELSFMIWQFAQDVIDDSMHDARPPYSEEQFSINQIDVLEIPHFSNRAKMTSLKWLEFMMNAPNIEEMPYNHLKEEFTEAEVRDIILYCRNDIINTYRWYQHLRGETEHEFYKGKDKVQMRINLIESLKFPIQAMSWNDVKIGDEINKRSYMQLTGCKIQDIYDLKKRRKATKSFTFREAIPDYVSFKTPQLQTYFDKVGKTRVALLQKDVQEFPITFKGTTYSIMRGGIHSTESNRIIIPKPGEILRDADIGSQYPNAIVKRGLFPSHLGKEWLIGYKGSIEKKNYYKKMGKTGDLNAKGLSEMYKLALNGGGYGKTGEMDSWQYDPRVKYFCTIGNEFEILMLIEMLELEGIHIVSANTDGIVAFFPESLDKTYYEVCNTWEKIVGNDVEGRLEYQDYKSLVQESVNHYVAIKPNDEAKIKGRLLVEDEMHKNNTDKVGRIERRAIVEYFKNGTPVEETVRGCKDIFDFCIGLKSSRRYHFQTVDTQSNITEHKKIIRFYISNKGDRLVKVLNEGEEEGIDVTRISRGYLVTMYNTHVEQPIENYDINYDYYIKGAQEIVEKLIRGKKYLPPNPDQLNLF